MFQDGFPVECVNRSTPQQRESCPSYEVQSLLHRVVFDVRGYLHDRGIDPLFCGL